jgi:twitching motility protein PilT
VVDLSTLLAHLMEQRGSDLHVKVGGPPRVRVDGKLVAAPFDPVTPADVDRIAREILPPGRAQEFTETAEADFAHSLPGVGRFRVNVHRQRGTVGLVFRVVTPGMPTYDALAMPPVVTRLVDTLRGLVLVTGPASSGKTTTVAALLDHLNQRVEAHIITIEDPIEVLHPDKQSIVTQREIGTDTIGFADALRRATRQDPDVIYLSEVPDAEVMWLALTAADTGNLVISTMRTTSAVETVKRVVDFFPSQQHRQVRLLLAHSLRGVISQRLLERADGKGRTPAVEVLVGTNRVYDAIVDGNDDALEQLISEGEYYGMQTFDQSLFDLYKDGMVSLRDALAAASRPEDLRIALQAAGLTAPY